MKKQSNKAKKRQVKKSSNSKARKQKARPGPPIDLDGQLMKMKLDRVFRLDHMFKDKTSDQCEEIILNYIDMTAPFPGATHFMSIDEKPSQKFLNELHAVYKRMGKRNFHAAKCLNPSCDKGAIGSHLISERDLRALDTEDTRLYQVGFNGNATELREVGSGYSQASKFMGFCNKHDTELFSIFETERYIGSYAQREAAVYRSLAREFRAKVATIRSVVIECNEAAKAAHETGTEGYIALSMYFANVAVFSLESMRAIVESMRKIEARMKGSNFSETGPISSLIYTIQGAPSFLSWGLSSPKYEILESDNPHLPVDFDGDMFHVSTHLISDNSYQVALSWDKNDKGTEAWLRQQILPSATMAKTRLAPLLISCCEVTFFTKEWWESLSSEHRNEVLMLPIEERPGAISLDRLDFCPLEVTDLEYKAGT